MTELTDSVRLYIKYCLLFKGKTWIEKSLGTSGWFALLMGGYALTKLTLILFHISAK